jgi:hypothetical protein
MLTFCVAFGQCIGLTFDAAIWITLKPFVFLPASFIINEDVVSRNPSKSCLRPKEAKSGVK